MDSLNGLGLFSVFAALAFLMKMHGCRAGDTEVDPKGYVAYCPCMGRFGNQGDHFLGALSFAHGLDRTLILPPWIEYPPQTRGSIQIPFDKYFQVGPLREYHRVITMETFMKELAPTIWPEGQRTGFCYRFSDGNKCRMKEGNPFGPFWDNFKIDFDSYTEYGPANYNTHIPGVKDQWDEKMPASEYPVIALAGAPAAFPVAKENRELHRYLHWSDEIDGKANRFIEESLPDGPFVAVHLRQGSDWVNACKHVSNSKQLFASPQCLGFNNEFGELTQDLCLASPDVVKKQIKAVVKRIKAKAVFIASDIDPDIKGIEKSVGSKVKVLQRKPAEPHVDLAILGKADHFIGNCVSSFSAFAKRERDVTGKPSSFFGFGEDYKKSTKRKTTDEL